jgi:hypothetical protein
MEMAASEAGPDGSELSERLGRLPEADVRLIVDAWLDEQAPGYPTYTLTEDGEDGWAFWIVPQDTTSYVVPDGRIQWMGTGWPENYSYDELTGAWLEVDAA